MTFHGMNYLAVITAAIAGFAFGALWYAGLGRAWAAALGMKNLPKPNPGIFVLTFVCQLFMAWMTAGLIGHIGEITVVRSILSAVFVWAGFILMSMIINHRFQGQSWRLTLIDGGHWLGVLAVMGLVIGLFGV